METDILRQLGLTGNEIKAYVTCLENGMLNISQISEKTGIYRTLVYDVIKSLMKQGLLSFVMKENKRYFKAADPDILTGMASEKQRLLEKTKDLVKKLKIIKKEEKEIESIEVLQGKKALKNLMEDILKTPHPNYLVLGYTGKVKETIPEYFEQWEKRRVKMGINRKAIGGMNLLHH